MKLRWTLILIVINALLLWAVVQHIMYSPAQRAFDSQVKTFLPLSKTDWDGMGVSTPASAWKVSRDRWGHWWLRSPIEWPAKPAIVSRMNGYLATLSIDSAFAVGELGRVGQGLRSYGLETPRAVLEVMSGAKTLSYKIGNTTPLGNKVYVLSADEKEVWVVDAGINEYLAYTPEQLRQEGFFPFNIIELEALDVEQNGVTTRFERKQGTNVWQLKLGDKFLELKPGLWETWLQNLSKVSTASSVKTDEAQQALRTPAARLNFQMLYGRRSLVVGDADKSGTQRTARWEGTQETFYIPSDVLAALQQPERFLEPRPLPLIPSEVMSFDWTVGGNTLSLRKLERGQWVVASQINAPADGEAVNNLLESLCSIEAKAKIRASNNAPQSAEKIRLQTAKQTVELGLTRTDGKVEAAYADSRVAYETAAWPNAPTAESMLDRRIFEEQPAELTSISFKTTTDGKEISYAADTAQAQALAALLKNTLRVQRWLPASETPAGTATHQLEVTAARGTQGLDFWKTQKGWVGQNAQKKFFEADAGLSLFLDTLVNL